MKAILALLPLIAGCAALPVEPDPLPPASPGGACRTEGLQPLVGQEASSPLGAEALRLSGARQLRWIQPGQAVTMDYRADRLNVHLDTGNRVERFACG